MSVFKTFYACSLLFTFENEQPPVPALHGGAWPAPRNRWGHMTPGGRVRPGLVCVARGTRSRLVFSWRVALEWGFLEHRSHWEQHVWGSLWEFAGLDSGALGSRTGGSSSPTPSCACPCAGGHERRQHARHPWPLARTALRVLSLGAWSPVGVETPALAPALARWPLE